MEWVRPCFHIILLKRELSAEEQDDQDEPTGESHGDQTNWLKHFLWPRIYNEHNEHYGEACGDQNRLRKNRLIKNIYCEQRKCDKSQIHDEHNEHPG